MKVYTVREPERQTVRVYVELNAGPDEGDGRYARWFQYRDAEGRIAIMKVAPGDEPPLWDRVPEPIAQALGEALAPRPAATERHLDDAIAVRDRLLAMVERLNARTP